MYHLSSIYYLKDNYLCPRVVNSIFGASKFTLGATKFVLDAVNFASTKIICGQTSLANVDNISMVKVSQNSSLWKLYVQSF